MRFHIMTPLTITNSLTLKQNCFLLQFHHTWLYLVPNKSYLMWYFFLHSGLRVSWAPGSKIWSHKALLTIPMTLSIPLNA